MEEDEGEVQIPTPAETLIETGIKPLTAFRTEAAMSIAELAEASGVGAEAIENFEVGQGGLCEAELEAIAKVLALPRERLHRN